MIVITSYPTKSIVTDSNISKWNACHHPIKIEMLRRDFEVQITFNDSATITITGGGLLLLAEISIGDTIYYELSTGVYGQAIITNTTPITATVTSGNIGTGLNNAFINLDTRLNYHVKTKIYYVNGSVGNLTYEEIGISINKPSGRGVVIVDISSFLKSRLGYDNDFDYSQLNWRDTNLSGIYNIVFSENWTGNDGAFSGISTTDLNYFSNSAKQIQDLYGTNMGEYVPFLTLETAKFLSKFNKPTYFTGFPFDISFIYSENIIGLEINKEEETKNVNGSTIATTSDSLSFYEGLGTNRLMLKQGYSSSVKEVDVWLESNPSVTATLKYVDDDYWDDDYSEEILASQDIPEPNNPIS